MREFISDDRVSAFVTQRTGLVVAPGQYTQLGVLSRGAVSCGIVFTHYSGRDVAITVAAASPNAFTKTFLTRCGHYIWTELDCARLTILTEQARVVELAQRLGAVTEGRKRDQFGEGRDATMLGLLKRDWKFK